MNRTRLRRAPFVMSGLLCLGLVATHGHSEELKTGVAEHMQQQSRKAAATMPKAGVTQADVKSRFGDPVAVKGPVGEPAITIWEYADYSVYFENQTVIHTVLKSG